MLMSLIYSCFKVDEKENMDDIKLLSEEDMESMETSLDDLNEALNSVPSVKNIPQIDPGSCIESPFSYVKENKHTLTSYDHLSLHNRKSRLKAIRECLISLRDEHLKILSAVQKEEKYQPDNYVNKSGSPLYNANGLSYSTMQTFNGPSEVIEQNIMNSINIESRVDYINRSIEKLENGIEESSALLSFTDHFIRIEMERDGLRFAMMRVIEENHRMQEELSVSQRRLIEAESELGILIMYN